MTGTVARYDCSKRNISFDYFVWQTHAVMLGAKEIVLQTSNGFGDHKETPEELLERYRSIIAPGPALMRLPSREGDEGEHCATHRLKGILKEETDIPRLRSVLPPGTERYTVTIRHCMERKDQNSRPIWREFAQHIGARVIEDYRDEPIALYERMALYAGAEMNFGVVNGPLALCYLSEYPMMMFDCASRAFAWEGHGVRVGKQIPFARPNQRLVWERPFSVGAILHEYEKLKHDLADNRHLPLGN